MCTAIKKKTRNTFLQHLTLSAIIDENASCLWMRLFPETERSDCLLIKLLWHLQGDFSSYQEISKWINLWSRKCWIVNCRGKGKPWYLNEHYDPTRILAKSSFCWWTTMLTLFADRFIQSIINDASDTEKLMQS